MKFHKKLVAGLMLAANLVISAHASSGGIPWDKAPIDVTNQASLQNGARIFVNYCLSCHSAAFMRYNRLLDYVTKVLLDFLNRRAFENWSSKTEDDLRKQIVKFLDSIKGPDKLIEKFKIVRFEQDKQQKDRVWLDIRLTPYFPAKSFVIKLDGHKGDDGNEWDSEYAQE